MKKVSAIIMSVVMVLCVIPFSAFATEKTLSSPASAYAEYDRTKVTGAQADYIDSLSYDQLAGILLDWVDRKIAANAESFDNFEVEVMGQTIAVDLDIKSIDDIMGYAGYLDKLGGDFENLNTSALTSLSRANGDVNFIYGLLQFMADNSDVFGKVFSWTEDTVFDYGKVGEYIEGLEDGDSVKTFYEDYLIGNNIQDAFITEIASEMGYTVPKNADGTRKETFDETLNNGILGWFVGLCENNGIISEEAAEAMLENYDLRTTDIYTLIKTFVTDVQSDNKVKVDTYYTFYLDNYIRAALKSMFGYTMTVGETVNDAALISEFKGVYKDLAMLNEISGGTVDYQAADGKYYRFTLDDTDVTSVKAVSWGESFINLDPPTVTVTDDGTFEAVYHPTTTDESAYIPNIYMDEKYEEMLSDSEYAEMITFGAVPQEYAAIISGEGTSLKDAFNMEVADDETVIANIRVTFEEIETEINKELAKKLPMIQSQADSAVAGAVAAATAMKANMGSLGSFLPDFTGSVTINSVTVELAYTGYYTDDEFVVEVTAVPTLDVTYGGNVWDYAQYAGITKEKIETDYIQPAIDNAVTDPIATVVVDNLSGTAEGLDDINGLLNFINTDFDVDYTVTAFAENYDAYNGVIGQSNRVLCSLLKMLLSSDGYASLDLTEGGNENLTANLQKLCNKADSLLTASKQFLDEEGFADFVASSGVNDYFASAHGFNANMVYELDFSSVESLYVCASEMVLDFIDDEQPGLINDLHMAIEGLGNLDAIAVAVTDYAMAKVLDKVSDKFDTFDYTYTATDASTVEDGQGKAVIMPKLTDLAFYAANWAFDDILNKTVNNAIDKLNEEVGSDIAHVSFKLGVQKGATWEDTLTALVDRFYELTDGIIIAVGYVEESLGLDTFDKISNVLDAVLPLETLFSNCASEEFICDIGMIVNDFIFDEALNGNFDNFLRLFETETKEHDIAKDVPVTKALINASQLIVDSIFPGTVKSDAYTPSLTVQEEFTSSANDAVIASNNMKSINARKTHLVPAALDLIRESGLLPYFASCEHSCGFNDFAEVPSTCEVKGHSAYKVCKECGAKIGYVEYDLAEHDYVKKNTVDPTCTDGGYTVYECSYCGTKVNRDETAATGHKWDGGKQTKAPTCTADGVYTYTCTDCKTTKTEAIKASGHSWNAGTVTKAPTCSESGVKTYSCSNCSQTKTEEIAKTAHVDGDGDNTCDVCGGTVNNSFGAKIKAFFRKIINWFKNLFR